MADVGDLHIGDLERHKESINKTGGINTQKSVFNTNSDSEDSRSGDYMVPGYNPMYMNRVEELANYGTVSGNNRALIQNPLDLAQQYRTMNRQSAMTTGGAQEETTVRSEEKRGIIKAQPDLKVFSGDVMAKGVFTPKAREAARHFFRQVQQWAGSFDDGGSGFYREMGINSLLDCLYVDGMSLKNFCKEQYFYKASNDPAQEQEALQNYVALIASRGNHVITLARPNINGNQAGVEFKNLEMDLSNVGSKEAAQARKTKERGNQVRSSLKKRMENDLTEATGMAFRKVNGHNMDGFNRLEAARRGLKGAGMDSEEYKAFDKKFSRYSGGLEKLGLKPDRDDINAPVARELKSRCEEAIRAAEEVLRSDKLDEATEKAVKNAKKTLETDLELLERAISRKLDEENATMSLDELLDSTRSDPNKGGNDGNGNNGGNGDGSGDNGGNDASGNTGNDGSDNSNNAPATGGADN